MNDTSEVAAAAAGAAAAVSEVQREEAIEESVAIAESAATESAVVASQAVEEASAAVQTASVAGAIAADASEQAAVAAEVAVSGHEQIQALNQKVDTLAAAHAEFATEIRGFFAKLEEQSRPNSEVQTVEVTHHAKPDNSTESRTNAGSGTGTSGTNVSRRHKFGKQR